MSTREREPLQSSESLCTHGHTQRTSGLTPPMLTPSLTGSAPEPVPFSSPSSNEKLERMR